MYLSSRATVVRNFAIATINGTITLIILLIAPLGLAAVISNTFLVTVASFFTATATDAIIRYLQPSHIKQIQADFEAQLASLQLNHSNNSSDLNRD